VEPLFKCDRGEVNKLIAEVVMSVQALCSRLSPVNLTSPMPQAAVAFMFFPWEHNGQLGSCRTLPFETASDQVKQKCGIAFSLKPLPRCKKLNVLQLEKNPNSCTIRSS